MARVEAVFELRDRMSRSMDRIRGNAERAERVIKQTDDAVTKLGKNDGPDRQAAKFARASQTIRTSAERADRSIKGLSASLRQLGTITARPKVELRGARETMQQLAMIETAIARMSGGGGGGGLGILTGLDGPGGGRGGGAGRGAPPRGPVGARIGFGGFSLPVRPMLPVAAGALLAPVAGTGLGALGGLAGAGIGAAGAGMAGLMTGMGALYGGGAATMAGALPVIRQMSMATEAIKKYRDEVKAAGGDTEKMAEAQRNMEAALRNVPARARGVARSILALREQYNKAFTEGSRYQAMLGTIERGAQFAAGRGMDMLTQSFDRFFPVFDRAANAMMDFFESPRGIREFRQWTEGLPRIADNMLKIGGAAGRLAGGLVRGFTPLTTMMTGGLARWFGNAADWANSERGMARMERFGAASMPIFRSLARVLGEFGRGIETLLVGNGGRNLTYFFNQIADGMPAFISFLDRSVAETPRFVELLGNLASTAAQLFGPNTAFDIGIRMLNNFATAVRGVVSALGPVGPALMAMASIGTIGQMIRGVGGAGMRGRATRAGLGGLLGGTVLGPLGVPLGATLLGSMAPAAGTAAAAAAGGAGLQETLASLRGGGRGGGGMGGVGGAAAAAGAAAGGQGFGRLLQNYMAAQGQQQAMFGRQMMGTLALTGLGLAAPGLAKGLRFATTGIAGAAAMVAPQVAAARALQEAVPGSTLREAAGARARGAAQRFGRGGGGGLLGRLFPPTTNAVALQVANEVQALGEEAKASQRARTAFQATRATGVGGLRGAVGAGLRQLAPQGGLRGIGAAALRMGGGPVGLALTLGTVGLGAYQFLSSRKQPPPPGIQTPLLDDPTRLRAMATRRARFEEYDTGRRIIGERIVGTGEEGTGFRKVPTTLPVMGRRYAGPDERFGAVESQLKKDTQDRAEAARRIQSTYRDITVELARQRRLEAAGKDNAQERKVREQDINDLLAARRSVVTELAAVAPTAVNFGMFGRPTSINRRNLNQLTLGLEAGQRADPGAVARRFGALTRGRRAAGAAEGTLMTRLARLAPGMDLNSVRAAARSGDPAQLEALRRQAGAYGGPEAENAFADFSRAVQKAGGTYGNFIARLKDLSPMYERYMVAPARRAARRISRGELEKLIDTGGERGGRDVPKWLKNLVGDAKTTPELRGIARRAGRVFISSVVDSLDLTPAQARKARIALRLATGLTRDGRVPTPRRRQQDPRTQPEMRQPGLAMDPDRQVGSRQRGDLSILKDIPTPEEAGSAAERTAKAATRELNSAQRLAEAKRGGRNVTKAFREGVKQPIEEVQKGGKDVAHAGVRGLRTRDKVENAKGTGRHYTNTFAAGMKSAIGRVENTAKQIVDAATRAAGGGGAVPNTSNEPNPPDDTRSRFGPNGGPVRNAAGVVVGGKNNGAFVAGRRLGSKIFEEAKARAAAAAGGVPTGSASGNLKDAIALAAEYGLIVSSFMRPQDKDSLHSVGRAVDVSGPAAGMAAFYKAALSKYKYVEELFYDPLGGVDKNQQIGPIGGHMDHVHIAFRQGGRVPGMNKWRGDSVSAMLSPGEVVLTHSGQQMIDRMGGPGTMSKIVERQRPHFGRGGSVGPMTVPKVVQNGRKTGAPVQITFNGDINVRDKAEYDAFVSKLAKDLELAALNSPMEPE